MATSQDFISPKEAAALHGLSLAWVKRLAQHGQIPGAFKINTRAWAIPRDWEPPKTRQQGR